MEKYKAIIVDDDPISQKIVEQCLNRSGVFETPLVLGDALSLKQKIQENVYDVIFLDVELPELSGIDFIKTFENLPHIILMSNMKHYAVDAFEIEVLDFLPKPIEYSRFLKTVNRLDKISLPNINGMDDDIVDSIFFKVNGKLQKIVIEDILFFESMSDYVKIITVKKQYVVLQTMTNLQKILPKNFMRCHRSYIINLNKVEALDDRVLEVEQHAVPVSRSYYNEIKNKIKVLG
jgi:DNA-binding LytR/AlgR family response regulator